MDQWVGLINRQHKTHHIQLVLKYPAILKYPAWLPTVGSHSLVSTVFFGWFEGRERRDR